ncbi:MAG: hypothetical protein KME19_14405 [Microcoleus vaginatus WJT46-NPBG5]|nr:hypothetical protein [Microcoleus vaginatus WJT46-NPBG5]
MSIYAVQAGLAVSGLTVANSPCTQRLIKVLIPRKFLTPTVKSSGNAGVTSTAIIYG